MAQDSEHGESNRSRFQQQAGARPPSFVAEFWQFLVHNKKWWLAPILIVLLLLCLMVMLTATPAAPFIYSLW